MNWKRKRAGAFLGNQSRRPKQEEKQQVQDSKSEQSRGILDFQKYTFAPMCLNPVRIFPCRTVNLSCRIYWYGFCLETDSFLKINYDQYTGI
jgi:hypothetical protein